VVHAGQASITRRKGDTSAQRADKLDHENIRQGYLEDDSQTRKIGHKRACWRSFDTTHSRRQSIRKGGNETSDEDYRIGGRRSSIPLTRKKKGSGKDYLGGLDRETTKDVLMDGPENPLQRRTFSVKGKGGASKKQTRCRGCGPKTISPPLSPEATKSWLATTGHHQREKHG